jgi:hypothetical protein
MTLLLSDAELAELAELTGYKTAQGQIEWLRARNWVFVIIRWRVRGLRPAPKN